ncbi:unnamed protein product [Urochloa humidicola]
MAQSSYPKRQPPSSILCGPKQNSYQQQQPPSPIKLFFHSDRSYISHIKLALGTSRDRAILCSTSAGATFADLAALVIGTMAALPELIVAGDSFSYARAPSSSCGAHAVMPWSSSIGRREKQRHRHERGRTDSGERNYCFLLHMGGP